MAALANGIAGMARAAGVRYGRDWPAFLAGADAEMVSSEGDDP